MKSITTISQLKGARVIVRVDYNVPFKGTKILDTRRIEASYRTVDTILKKGGTPILITHLGEKNASVRPVATYLSKKYSKVVFIDADPTSKKIRELLGQISRGTVVLLENIRRYSGEEKNIKSFAKQLASLGDYYVNDAFSVSHRAHASIVGVPKYLPSYAGYQLIEETKKLTTVFDTLKHPFLFILGGAKFGTKIPLIKRYLTRADDVVIAGALLNDFYKVAGFEVGKSVVEKGYDTEIQNLLKNPKLLLPTDITVMRKNKTAVVTPTEIQKSDIIVDIGPESVAHIAEKIKKAKLVVWNGPTGWYEKGFTKATTALAQVIAKSSAESVVGGGDTGALVEKVFKGKKHPRVFISTGGGATLEYLAKGSLPGLQALE